MEALSAAKVQCNRIPTVTQVLLHALRRATAQRAESWVLALLLNHHSSLAALALLKSKVVRVVNQNSVTVSDHLHL